MAKGDPHPAWILPGVKPKFALWSFGGGRPFGCKDKACERWHAGIDLTGAPHRAVVVAPERARVIGVDKGWSGAAKAMYLEALDSGLFFVLGGFIKNSHAEFIAGASVVVEKGAKLGRVLGDYGMIHFETYAKGSKRTKNSVWYRGSGPPAGLLNPTNYVERMVGEQVSLLRSAQRHAALAALGFFSGTIDGPWTPASVAALRAAQESLGVAVDGVWGPATEAALRSAIEPEEGERLESGDNSERSGTHLWVAAGVGVLGVAAGLALLARRRRAQ
ncbi:MAG: peptidoglycan-binding protein [Myxococcales bacterium]|nr:peptidoglycan-binding protein [Myxococcales bacterium]